MGYGAVLATETLVVDYYVALGTAPDHDGRVGEGVSGQGLGVVEGDQDAPF